MYLKHNGPYKLIEKKVKEWATTKRDGGGGENKTSVVNVRLGFTPAEQDVNLIQRYWSAGLITLLALHCAYFSRRVIYFLNFPVFATTIYIKYSATKLRFSFNNEFTL